MGFDGQRTLAHDEFVRSVALRMAFSAHAAAEKADSGSLLEAMRVWCAANGVEPTAEDWRIWANYISFNCAADPTEIGAKEFNEAKYTGDGARIQFRIVEGYSALMQKMAEGLDVRLSTPVHAIEWSPDGVRVHCGAETYEARRAIVSLPLAVLQQNDVRFDPPLPESKQRAAAGLGAGANGKIVLLFDEVCWPDDLTMFLSGRDTQFWWRPGRLQENEAPVITAYFGGSAVERFRALGDDAPLAALRDLEEFFGAKLESRLQRAQFIDWPADPYAKMSYSYIPQGGAGLRAQLAEPIADTLFFAGEATNSVRPSCVHGAIESGLRAAEGVAECKRQPTSAS
jgi:monoamine oxidase